MNGWLMWGLVLPVLLVVAGIVARRRRKDGR
jgi:LPXTG-motif cell wall-anchored protein